MRPGQVNSDQQAFQQVLGRLESDVGTIHQLVEQSKKVGYFPNTAPLWALVRMTIPIAEATGDLIYGKTSTGNLICLLENDFEAVRPGAYKGKSNILALMFRHSLTHTDELRSLFTGGKEMGWLLSSNQHANHMQVAKADTHALILYFDTTAFYDDLVAVCRAAMAKTWNGEVMNRYNGWLMYDLDQARQTQNVRNGIREINAL